jgi:hypothetical protein
MLRRSPGSDRADPLALDDHTAERRLPGCPAPAGAQFTDAGEAQPLPSANAVPGADELAGQAAVTRPHVMVGAPSSSPVVTPARAARTRQRQQLKVAVAVVVAALAVGGIAGALSLGEPIRRTAPTDVGVAAPSTQGGGQDAASADPTSAAAELAAIKELCLAYLADRDAGFDAAAFRALAAAAGGAGNIATWCQRVTAKPVGGRGQGRGGPPSTRGKGRGRDRPRGPPDDRGRGHREPLTTSR